MTTLLERIKTSKFNFAFVAFYLLITLWIFADVLTYWITLSTPDDGPYYLVGWKMQQLDNWLSGAAPFSPQRLLALFDPIAVHDVSYMFHQLLFILAITFYLRTLRLSPVAAWGGGLLAGFSGYLFTLFSAGHGGWFYLLACAFWSLGLINRCFQTRRWHYYVLLGATLVWGMPSQPDLSIYVALLFAAYGLWRLWLNRQTALATLPKFALSLLVAIAIGLPSIKHTLGNNMADRDAQIEQTAPNATEQTPAQKAQQRWDFATGWSLPPTDTLELLIPGYYGNDSMRPPYPFWGALGRPHDFKPGAMMPNYRQHTIYLGLTTLLLALIGMGAYIRNRRTYAAQPTADTDTPDLRDSLFWTTVALIGLILAFGRYTPIYKYFYALPYMDYLRAPVKFLHFTEIAAALLAGFGLQTLLTQTANRRWANLLPAAFILGILLIVAIATMSYSGAIAAHIKTLGLGLDQFAAALTSYAQYNTWRAVGLALLLLALLYTLNTRAINTPQRRTWLVMLILLIGVTDLATVARRYVIPIDLQAYYQPNHLTREIAKRTNGQPANIANHATQNVWSRDLLSTALRIQGNNIVSPDPSDPNAPERPLAQRAGTVTEYWGLTGTRYILVPTKDAPSVAALPGITPVAQYEITPNAIRTARAGNPNTITLLERQNHWPALYTNPADYRLHDGKATILSQAKGTPATFTAIRGQKDIRTTRATITTQAPALLVWTERYNKNTRAKLDGKPIPLLQANEAWCAVELPAGTHTLTTTIPFTSYPNAISALLSIAILLGTAIYLLRRLLGKR